MVSDHGLYDPERGCLSGRRRWHCLPVGTGRQNTDLCVFPGLDTRRHSRRKCIAAGQPALSWTRAPHSCGTPGRVRRACAPDTGGLHQCGTDGPRRGWPPTVPCIRRPASTASPSARACTPTDSSRNCCAGISRSHPTRCATTHTPKSSPCTTSSPPTTGAEVPP